MLNNKYNIQVNGKTLSAEITLNAPRELVFDVMTKPEHLKHWYGPRNMTLVVCDVDYRVGGKYRYVMRDPKGNEFGFSGEYLTIDRPKYTENTWAFESFPDAVCIESATFEDLGEKTKVTIKSDFPSEQDLKGWEGSGGPEGMSESYDRLQEYLNQSFN